MIQTRRSGIPIRAELKTHPTTGHPVWEVRIAPDLPMDLVPFELRSTYVCPRVEIPLNIAITQVAQWVEQADAVDLALLWANLEDRELSRARLLDLITDTGEIWVGQELPDDALWSQP